MAKKKGEGSAAPPKKGEPTTSVRLPVRVNKVLGSAASLEGLTAGELIDVLLRHYLGPTHPSLVERLGPDPFPDREKK